MAPVRFYEAIAMLVGGIIGAGVLGIPNVVERSGAPIGLALIIVLGLAYLCVNLMLGEVALRTGACHQLPGYARIYLGKAWGRVMAIAVALFNWGAMTAYTIGIATTLSVLIGGDPLWWGVGYYSLVSVIIWSGLSALAFSELLLVLAQFLLLAGISALAVGSSAFDISRLAATHAGALLAPVGVILFALSADIALPTVCEALSRQRGRIKSAIIIGSLIPIALYALFTMGVIGIGAAGAEIATVGIGAVLGPLALAVGSVFAILSMGTSHLLFGFALKECFQYDFRLPHAPAWFVSVIVPPLVILFTQSFVEVLDMAGSLSIGLIGILVLWMHARASSLGKRSPEYTVSVPLWAKALIGALFLLGTLNLVLNLLS